jgi:hypothetical protein
LPFYEIKNSIDLFKQIFRREEAADRPKSDFQPKTLADLNMDGGSTHGSDGVNGKFSIFSCKSILVFKNNRTTLP